MFESIIGGIISGVLTAILFALINGFYNFRANKDVKSLMLRLSQYLQSISNDIIWGAEDCQADYYDNLITKVHFCIVYLVQVNLAIKPLNFIFKKKYISKQIKEIENGLDYLLGNVVGAKGKEEKIARLKEFYKRYQCASGSILFYRVEFVLNLLNKWCITPEEAAEMVSANTPEEKDQVKAILLKV